MKVEVKCYKIVCDCCGETFENANGNVCYADDPDGSLIESDVPDSDWIIVGDKHYCPDCYEYDDDDNIVTKDGHIIDGSTGDVIEED